MIAESVRAQSGAGRIRPADPGRDLRAIADLIEVAFREELDRTGNTLVAEMRHLASLGPLLILADYVSPLPGGYVWEQAGQVMGNVTITPEDPQGRRWFISNVAVHPDYQGHGIGRKLMEAALAHARRRGGRRALLQVRTENERAQRLYRSLGFWRYDTVIELLRPSLMLVPPPPHLQLRRLLGKDWRALAALALESTPAQVVAAREISALTFRPPRLAWLRNSLEAIFSGRHCGRWGADGSGRLDAALSLLAYDGRTPARLDLAVRPLMRGAYEGAMADAGLSILSSWGARAVAATVSTSHDEALHALEQRRFLTVRSLDQLVLEL